MQFPSEVQMGYNVSPQLYERKRVCAWIRLHMHETPLEDETKTNYNDGRQPSDWEHARG